MTAPAPSSASTTASPLRARPDRSFLWAFGLSLLVSILIILPYFWWGSASGHDFEFHAASWLDAAAQWHQGILYPRWHQSANHGFGEPRFLFYPPLSWMLGAALGSLIPWSAVPAAFIVLVQTMAGLAAFALVRRFSSSRAAVFAAVAYAANPYALLVVYMRSDFAEQLASAVLPLVPLFACLLAVSPPGPRWSRSGHIAGFAVTFAAVWLSNAPAGVLASYSFLLLFAWFAWEKKSWRPLLFGFAAIALGLALSAFYLIPAAYEQRWVNISQALSAGLLPSENFLYTWIADPEHNLFNLIASTVAVLMIVLAFLAAVFVIRRSRAQVSGLAPAQRDVTSSITPAMLLLAAACAFMMLRLSSFLWPLLPKLRFVQFPWRWALVLAVPYAWFLGSVFAWPRRRVLWILALLAVSGGSAAFLITHTWWDSDDMSSLHDALDQQQGFDGTDEYDPAGDDHYNLPPHAPEAIALAGDSGPVPKADLAVLQWGPERKLLRVTSAQPLRVALRLLDYPAWRVEVNGKPVSVERPEQTAQMIVPLPAGTSLISVRFARTPDRTAGGLVSLGALFLTAVLFGLARVKLRAEISVR